MGSVDKAMFSIDGETMISRITRKLSEAGLEPIRIAVAREEDVEIYGSSIGDGPDVEWVLDGKMHAGPIEAIEESLENHKCDPDDVIQLAAVDYPWIPSELFSALRDGLRKEDSLIMPHDGKWCHPLFSLIRPNDVFEIIRGDRRPLHIQFTESTHSVLLEDPLLLRNINSHEDL